MTEDLINVHIEDVEYTYPSLLHLRKWIGDCVVAEEKEVGPLNIIFCSDAYLLEYNKTYLQHDYYTDIITFEYAANPVEGDLYISLDRVKDNAASRSISLQDEVDRVIVHGVLHLLGYADKSEDEKKMITEKEDFYLSKRHK